jgi:hypothetical protein
MSRFRDDFTSSLLPWPLTHANPWKHGAAVVGQNLPFVAQGLFIENIIKYRNPEQQQLLALSASLTALSFRR